VTPGDRPDLPLAEEPSGGLRAPATGTGALGGVQPVHGGFPLEEEPALWPTASGAVPAARAGTAPRRRRAQAPAAGAALPATGAGTGAAGALLLLLGAGLGWRARRLKA
jgi:hypothetical protein